MTQWYIFQNLTNQEVLDIQKELLQIGNSNQMNGLILLALEGCNGTVAGTPEAIETIRTYLQSIFSGIAFQDWTSDVQPFKRFKVDVREEIVALKHEGISPKGNSKHLSPKEFHTMIENGTATVLDTRNIYETNIGTFKDAVIPPLKSFQEFPEYIQKSNIPKDKPVLMFCTSGIRCEKASEEMAHQGYQEVYQLDGGVTNYLKEYPNGYWNGECFMFDHRVAVDSNLQPSKRYSLCPRCGNPGDVATTCTICKTDCTLCEECLAKAPATCSRQCKNDLALRIKQGV
ncbi:MAG: rhodanese-like domain-containing protein [Candidatus Andersenbacteria bacterium]